MLHDLFLAVLFFMVVLSPFPINAYLNWKERKPGAKRAANISEKAAPAVSSELTFAPQSRGGRLEQYAPHTGEELQHRSGVWQQRFSTIAGIALGFLMFKSACAVLKFAPHSLIPMLYALVCLHFVTSAVVITTIMYTGRRAVLGAGAGGETTVSHVTSEDSGGSVCGHIGMEPL